MQYTMHPAKAGSCCSPSAMHPCPAIWPLAAVGSLDCCASTYPAKAGSCCCLASSMQPCQPFWPLAAVSSRAVLCSTTCIVHTQLLLLLVPFYATLLMAQAATPEPIAKPACLLCFTSSQHKTQTPLIYQCMESAHPLLHCMTGESRQNNGEAYHVTDQERFDTATAVDESALRASQWLLQGFYSRWSGACNYCNCNESPYKSTHPP